MQILILCINHTDQKIHYLYFKTYLCDKCLFMSILSLITESKFSHAAV